MDLGTQRMLWLGRLEKLSRAITSTVFHSYPAPLSIFFFSRGSDGTRLIRIFERNNNNNEISLTDTEPHFTVIFMPRLTLNSRETETSQWSSQLRSAKRQNASSWKKWWIVRRWKTLPSTSSKFVTIDPFVISPIWSVYLYFYNQQHFKWSQVNPTLHPWRATVLPKFYSSQIVHDWLESRLAVDFQYSSSSLVSHPRLKRFELAHSRLFGWGKRSDIVEPLDWIGCHLAFSSSESQELCNTRFSWTFGTSNITNNFKHREESH